MTLLSLRRHPLRLALAALSISAVTIAMLVMDSRPRVSRPETLTQADMLRVEQLIVNNSPARFSRQGERTIVLDTDELNLLAAFMIENLSSIDRLAVQLTPAEPVSRIDVSVPVGRDWLRGYLNISADIALHDGQPELLQLRAGHLTVPPVLQRWLLDHATRRLASTRVDPQQVAGLLNSVRDVEIRQDSVALHLHWEAAHLGAWRDQARQMLLDTSEQQRLLHYYRLSHETAMAIVDEGGPITLHELLSSVFASASERTAAGSDAVGENRGALQAVALYVNDIDPALLISELPAGIRRTKPIVPPLLGRRDLSQHFILSAAIAASGGAIIADVLSSSKELHDARHGTGFDFSDVTANMAGAALGSASVADAAAAARIQQRMADADTDALYMPQIPVAVERLDEQAFIEQYGSRGSPAFRERSIAIGGRIAGLPLYE